MKLLFVNILCLTNMVLSAPVFQKCSFKEICAQRFVSPERISISQRLATLWGIKKKLERWQKVVDSAIRAISYSVEKIPAEDIQYTVRVLLDEQRFQDGTHQWELQSENGFIIVIESEDHPSFMLNSLLIHISYKKGSFSIEGKRVPHGTVRIIPVQGTLTYDGVTYSGDFLFTRYKEHILCINCVELESYVGSVLNAESWPGWPLEVNKVFAIMSRSYVLSHMLTAQKMKRPYHVRNTNSHQNYHGVHTNTIIEEAVTQTAGMFLIYNQKPVLAMFDACCGGVIPAHIGHGVDFDKEPYLARSYPCTYCKHYSVYSWEKTLSLQDIEKKLHAAQLCHEPVHEIKVVARDKAGLAKTVHIKTKHGIITCKGKQIYSALPEVKSYAFDMVKRGQSITISGYGHGHHLGVCQWGAREMVRRGYTYQQILSFYYPGTRLATIA